MESALTIRLPDLFPFYSQRASLEQLDKFMRLFADFPITQAAGGKIAPGLCVARALRTAGFWELYNIRSRSPS
jgi:hypothetical protein